MRFSFYVGQGRGKNINGDCNKDWHEKVGNKRWTVVQSGYVDPQQR